MVSKCRFFDLCLATLRDFSLLSSHERFDSLACAGGNMDPNSCRRIEHWGGLSVYTPNRKTTVWRNSGHDMYIRGVWRKTRFAQLHDSALAREAAIGLLFLFTYLDRSLSGA